MLSRKFLLSTSLLVPLMLGACANSNGPITRLDGNDNAAANVNANYANGRTEMPQISVPTLQEMQMVHAVEDKGLSDKDRLRLPALRDAALSYGALGGLAYASKQINIKLRAESPHLSKIYDFTPFLIKAPSGATILPPVISEQDNTYEQQDAGKTLRVADKYYLIVQQARLAPVAPLWQTYLTRSYNKPEAPPDAVLPKNAEEQKLWAKFVAEGWDQGKEQATEIFNLDLNKLDRDFQGMIQYAKLLEEHKVKPPVVAETNLGVTGTGREMRENDRVTRITQDPELNVRKPSQWRAPVSDQSPTDAATPVGGQPGRFDH